MNRYLLLLSALTFAGGPAVFASGLDATATFTDSQISPGEFQYDLTLNNTGTTTIGTFWFSWIPGAGFMPVAPTDVVSPAGWADLVTNGNAAILWSTPSNLVAPGGSQSGFEFDSTLTPAQLQADFPGPGLGTGDPINTAFVYIAAPLFDPGAQLVVNPMVASTPEPTTTVTIAFGFALIVLCSKLLRRRNETIPNP
jgi:hypothetical protein